MMGNAVAQIYGYHRVIASESGPDGNLHNAEGLSPYGELIQASDGKLYGAAFQGGSNGSGTIFYVSDGPNAGLGARPVPVYTFSAIPNVDGAIPSGLTFGADGFIYGVTQGGGANGTGTIFKMTPAGLLTTIYTFSATDAAGFNTDGAGPIGKLLQMADGSFYGVTRVGGANGTGTVYRIGADMSFSSVYSFASVDPGTHANSSGGGPLAGLTLGVDGNLYSVTEYGGALGGGVVFRLTPAGAFTLLHDFIPDYTSSSDGFQPRAALLLASDGNFYGTTVGGGADGGGVVFRIAPDGTYAIVHQFRGPYDTPPVVDGMAPDAPLIELPDGNLVGTTDSGYGPAIGTIFAVSKSGTYRTVFEFIDTGTIGVGPSGLTLGSNGILYGLTGGITAQNAELAEVGTAYALQLTNSPTATISVSPDTVPLGHDFTVSWSAPEATSCQFGQDSTFLPASGSFTTGSILAAAGPVVYQLNCLTPNGNTTASVVEAVYLPPPTVKISLSTTSITVGGSTSLSWSSTLADTCEASGNWSGQQDPEGTTSESPTVPGNYTYTITCTNGKGTAHAAASLTVSEKTMTSGRSGGGGALDGKCLLFLLGLTIWRCRSAAVNCRSNPIAYY
jgi:uncharacterized repeat protein (TIGR03803 family)